MLRSIRYGEADRIVHLYSATRGRIGAIAKGSRRPKSRFGGRLEPFFRLDLVLYEGRGDLFTVTGASTVDGHGTLRSNGPALGSAGRACDAVLRLLDSGEANEAAYNLLCTYLRPARRRSRVGQRSGCRAGLPAQARTGGGFLTGAGELRQLRGGRSPGGVLRLGRGSGLLELRGRRVPVQRGGAPVHGRCAGAAAVPGAGGGAANRGAGRPGDHRDARAPRPRAPARRGLAAATLFRRAVHPLRYPELDALRRLAGAHEPGEEAAGDH